MLGYQTEGHSFQSACVQLTPILLHNDPKVQSGEATK